MTTGFDDYLRRLDEIKREAALAERERIIALLEPLVACESCAKGDVAEDCSAKSYAYAIELIKGENK